MGGNQSTPDHSSSNNTTAGSAVHHPSDTTQGDVQREKAKSSKTNSSKSKGGVDGRDVAPAAKSRSKPHAPPSDTLPKKAHSRHSSIIIEDNDMEQVRASCTSGVAVSISLNSSWVRNWYGGLYILQSYH